MSDFASFHSFKDCILSSSKSQIFVNSSKVIVSSTEAASRLVSFSPHHPVAPEPQARDTKKYKSPEEVENQVQNGGKEQLVDAEKDFKSDVQASKQPLSPSISGKQISSYFPDFEIKQGVIQPTELVHPSNPDASKWIYTCSHAIQQQDGSSMNVIFLQDVQELKDEYSELSRAPVALDSVKKKISLQTPEFILENQSTYGDIITLRISANGQVLEQFPLSPTFLGTDRSQIHGSFIMGLVHPDDHIILTQCLSECLVSGTCHFVLRWSNSHSNSTTGTDKTEWIQVRATKSVDDSILLCVSQLCQPVSQNPILEESVKIVSDAWSYFSSSVAHMGTATAPGLTNFFSTKATSEADESEMNRDSKVVKDRADPKILKTEQL